MSKAAPPQRWFSAWRAPALPAVTDPADLGTAFGLDLSLHEPPADPGKLPAPRPARRGWMQRLAARAVKPAS
jgi:hypothetical protein